METSPTGTPVLSPKLVPYIVGLLGLAGVGMSVLPSHTIAFKVCAFLTGLGGIFGVVSPGARKAE